MAAMMPCIGFASEVKGSMGGMTESQDTVFTVNNRNIVVSQDDCQTSVKVYKNDGKEMTLTSETKFVDGQEVERVFVTSPFIPQNYSKRKLSLQSHRRLPVCCTQRIIVLEMVMHLSYGQ